MNEKRSRQLPVHTIENYPGRRMNHKLDNDMKMWTGNGNTTTLLFSLKGLGTLHQEKRGQVNIIAMEHLDNILFHKSIIFIFLVY